MQSFWKALISVAAICSSSMVNAAESHHEERTEGSPDICYGLSLSDASDIGPYQAGALIGLLRHQQKTGEKYQIVTGVALGALNAYILATNKPDDL